MSSNSLIRCNICKRDLSCQVVEFSRLCPYPSVEISNLIISTSYLAIFAEIILFFLAFFLGEIQISWISKDGVMNLSFILIRPIFLEKIATIFFLDFLFLVFFNVFTKTKIPINKCGEAVIVLVFTFSLWKIVFNNFLIVLFSSTITDEQQTTLPSLTETLIFLIFLVSSKEWIFRKLDNLNRLFPSPFLSFFSWHHRKDAIFNLIFGFTVFLSGIIGAVEKIDFFFAIVKIFLLGSASLRITMQCLRIILNCEDREDKSVQSNS